MEIHMTTMVSRFSNIYATLWRMIAEALMCATTCNMCGGKSTSSRSPHLHLFLLVPCTVCIAVIASCGLFKIGELKISALALPSKRLLVLVWWRNFHSLCISHRIRSEWRKVCPSCHYFERQRCWKRIGKQQQQNYATQHSFASASSWNTQSGKLMNSTSTCACAATIAVVSNGSVERKA